MRANFLSCGLWKNAKKMILPFAKQGPCGEFWLMEKLNAAQIKAALGEVPGWKKQAAVICRQFEFKDFPAAMKFVNAVAKLAEQKQHHPDIDIRWNKVTLALTTHDAGGLTEKDFALAKKFNGLSAR
jgi:4a-hydroxytetrahydrobiopterin dehydratase